MTDAIVPVVKPEIPDEQGLEGDDRNRTGGRFPSRYRDELNRIQGGRCAMCGAESSERGDRLCVDHCHTTGLVRGLLCRQCNLGLGALKDSIPTLVAAIRYLSCPPGVLLDFDGAHDLMDLDAPRVKWHIQRARGAVAHGDLDAAAVSLSSADSLLTDLIDAQALLAEMEAEEA